MLHAYAWKNKLFRKAIFSYKLISGISKIKFLYIEWNYVSIGSYFNYCLKQSKIFF